MYFNNNNLVLNFSDTSYLDKSDYLALAYSSISDHTSNQDSHTITVNGNSDTFTIKTQSNDAFNIASLIMNASSGDLFSPFEGVKDKNIDASNVNLNFVFNENAPHSLTLIFTGDKKTQLAAVSDVYDFIKNTNMTMTIESNVPADKTDSTGVHYGYSAESVSIELTGGTDQQLFNAAIAFA